MRIKYSSTEAPTERLKFFHGRRYTNIGVWGGIIWSLNYTYSLRFKKFEK